MKLHTLATKQNHEIVTYHKQYLKLVEYTQADCQRLMDQAKHYYIKMHAESESTDFNDRYSDSWTRLFPITLQNILVANGNFVGAVVQGTGKYQRNYVICTLNTPKAHWYDGSDYSSTSKDYFLLKYDLPECALDFAQAYHIAQVTQEYKKGANGNPDTLQKTYNYTHLLMAFDVIVQNQVAVGAKYGDHTYLLADPATISQTFTKQDEYVSTKYFVNTLTLTKTNF